MLETSARLLRLLSLLQSRRDWTGAELTDRLGVGLDPPELVPVLRALAERLGKAAAPRRGFGAYAGPLPGSSS